MKKVLDLSVNRGKLDETAGGEPNVLPHKQKDNTTMNKVMTPFGMMENHSNPNSLIDQQDEVSRMAFIDPQETPLFEATQADIEAGYLDALEQLVISEPSENAYYQSESIDEMVF